MKNTIKDPLSHSADFDIQDDQLPQVWILWWKYSDGSNQGVLRGYKDESRAKEDFELVKESTDKEYILDTIPFFL